MWFYGAKQRLRAAALKIIKVLKSSTLVPDAPPATAVVEAPPKNQESKMYNYACKIISWLDGDTADVEIDLGFHIGLRERVRVDGINSPEIHSKDADEKRHGVEAKQAAEAYASPGTMVLIQTAKAGRFQEKFGRWLAKITLVDGTDFATRMIAGGFAKEYHGEKR